MASQLVYKINSQPSQIEVAKGGVTLYNMGPGRVTVSTKTSFLPSRTASISQYAAMPWTSAPLWARSTSEPTLLVIPGQHNIVSPQVTLSGETVNVTGTVHLAPTAKVTIDGAVDLAPTSKITIDGPVDLAPTSKVTVDGTVHLAPTAKVTIDGPVDLAPTSKVTVDGPVDLAPTSKITIDGTVHLAPTAKVTIDGTVAVLSGQLTSTGIPLQATASQMLPTTFGSGTTGTVTISTNATLTHKAQYKTLTVDATLTAPWEVFASVEITGSGVIANDGYSEEGTGAGGLAGSFYGGGAGAVAPSSGTPPPTADFTGGSGGNSYYFGTAYEGGKAGRQLVGTLLFSTLLVYTLSGGGGGATSHTTSPLGGGGAGVVMVAAKVLSGSFVVQAKGGNARGATASNYAGTGGGGIALVYSHNATTWTGHVTVNAGTSVTHPQPAAVGQRGGTVVRLKFVGQNP